MITVVEQDQEQLRSLVGRLILSLQAGEMDQLAWEELTSLSRALTLRLRASPLVPKSLLKELRFAIKAMRAEAVRHKDHQRLLKMADELELTFDLILVGEAHGDRVPGVPRII